MQKKENTHIRVSFETKELLDEAKKYPEESYNKVIKRALSGSNDIDTATNIDGRTPLEEQSYRKQMKQKVI